MIVCMHTCVHSHMYTCTHTSTHVHTHIRKTANNYTKWLLTWTQFAFLLKTRRGEGGSFRPLPHLCSPTPNIQLLRNLEQDTFRLKKDRSRKRVWLLVAKAQRRIGTLLQSPQISDLAPPGDREISAYMGTSGAVVEEATLHSDAL